jgi:hypothetical protein
MTNEQYLKHAKSQGTTLTQSYLYTFAQVGMTDEEETRVYTEDYIQDDLDPKLVLEMARKWTRERQWDKIPKSEYMAQYNQHCLA